MYVTIMTTHDHMMRCTCKYMHNIHMTDILHPRRFILSPNFMAWFALRKEEANQKLRLLHLDTLCKAVS